MNTSAAQAYDLPEPTGPIMPRTNALDVRNLYTSGLLEKSKFRPVEGISLELASLVRDIDNLFNDIFSNILYKQQYAKFLGHICQDIT
jgi:hypothetical protein